MKGNVHITREFVEEADPQNPRVLLDFKMHLTGSASGTHLRHHLEGIHVYLHLKTEVTAVYGCARRR